MVEGENGPLYVIPLTSTYATHVLFKEVRIQREHYRSTRTGQPGYILKAH